MTQIAVSRLHFPITTLGPGRRIGVWFQGCSIRCAGCISADTWLSGHGLTTVDAVLEALASWVPSAEGITISGGEPFDQPEALRELLTALRSDTETDIFVYSGYPFESLRDWLESTPGLIDALMTDPYDERASQTLPLRGSDNQRLHLLTDLGRTRFADGNHPALSSDRRLEAMFDEEGGVWLAGIPRTDDFRRLREILTNAGHQVTLSQAGAAGQVY